MNPHKALDHIDSVSQELVEALEFHKTGRVAEAEALCRRILRRDPDNPDALHLLGIAIAQGGQPEVALRHIARAISLNPIPPFYHNNLGNILHDLSRFTEALLCYEEALRRDPDYADAHNNVANTLVELGRFDEALVHHLEALRLKPDFPQAFGNLASTLRTQGLYEEALACYEEALRLNPGDADAHAGRATLWLLMGDFQRGWLEYEWRWMAKGFTGRTVDGPLWDGTPAMGQRILLHAEQGLGDAIQFIRYAPLVKDRGATVLVECQPRLASLLESMPEIDRLIPAGSPLPYFDAHLPLLSLPRVFKTMLDSIPRVVPYLRVPPEKAEQWRYRLPGDGRRKVGLVWAGNPEYRNDRNRSVPLSQFAPLGRVRGVRFFSLQRSGGDGARPPAGLEMESLETESGESTDTAAALLSLDLVISVDTMVAHLAGALGVPVWTLLPWQADWRWLLDRDDSPWYPTMRLFRQPAAKQWEPVMERVAEALQHVVGQ